MLRILQVVSLSLFFFDTLFAQPQDAELKEIQREYELQVDAWHAKFGEVNTSDGAILRYREWPGWSFAPRFIALAENAGASMAGFDSLNTVLEMANSVGVFDRELFDHYERAMELLRTKHLDKDMRIVCTRVRPSKQSEILLRALMNRGESKELRAEACFRLGRLMSLKREMCLPESWVSRPSTTEFGKYTASRTRENLQLFIAKQDIKQLQADALQCFNLVISDYSDVRAMQSDEKLMDWARREVFELEKLAIGVSAPDISGTDLDGERFRLSDYRGKVVLLVFWASWCGPCMGDIPHEKEIHEKFKGRPFEIIGVNADKTLESAQKCVKENAIPWRSFRNGKEGPITSDWNVRAWPTLYILDQKGIIRFKHLRREDLDAPLEQLIKEAELKMSKDN